MATAAEFLDRDDDDSVSLGLLRHALEVRELGRRRNRRAAERAFAAGGASAAFSPHSESVANGLATVLLLAAVAREIK